jgi:hypothetical protein
MGGVAKEYITKLGCEKYFHTEHCWRCSKFSSRRIEKGSIQIPLMQVHSQSQKSI